MCRVCGRLLLSFLESVLRPRRRWTDGQSAAKYFDARVARTASGTNARSLVVVVMSCFFRESSFDAQLFSHLSFSCSVCSR